MYKEESTRLNRPNRPSRQQPPSNGNGRTVPLTSGNVRPFQAQSGNDRPARARASLRPFSLLAAVHKLRRSPSPDARDISFCFTLFYYYFCHCCCCCIFLSYYSAALLLRIDSQPVEIFVYYTPLSFLSLCVHNTLSKTLLSP